MDWDGSMAWATRAIRAQVTGYLLSQNYSEGSFVRKGTIAVRDRSATLSSGSRSGRGDNWRRQTGRWRKRRRSSSMLRAPAGERGGESRKDTTRCKSLHSACAAAAITQQEFDNATQNNLSAKAQVEAAKAQTETAKEGPQIPGWRMPAGVEAAKAAVRRAQVNLGFTRLTSPIDGIAGIAQIQIGNLVSPTTNAITTVSTVDPIKVNFRRKRPGISPVQATGYADEAAGTRSGPLRRDRLSAQRKVWLSRTAR